MDYYPFHTICSYNYFDIYSEELVLKIGVRGSFVGGTGLEPATSSV